VREKMCVSCVLQSGIDHLPGCAPLPAHIPLYLYPFLNTVSKARPFEYLRLTSLGVIGALVKVRLRPTSLSVIVPFPLTLVPGASQLDDSEVINFLLQTEIIPLCLRIMETGSELSKTVCVRWGGWRSS